MKSLDTKIAVLKDISTAIVHEKNIPVLLNKILAALRQRMEFARGTFTFLDKNVYRIGASIGLSDEGREKGVYLPGEGVTGQVAQSGLSQIVPDISVDKRFLNRTGAHDTSKKTAFICVPIIHLENVIGTLSVDRIVAKGVELEQDMLFLDLGASPYRLSSSQNTLRLFRKEIEISPDLHFPTYRTYRERLSRRRFLLFCLLRERNFEPALLQFRLFPDKRKRYFFP